MGRQLWLIGRFRTSMISFGCMVGVSFSAQLLASPTMMPSGPRT